MIKHIDNKLEYKHVKLSSLEPHPNNPNTHSQTNLNEIAASINNVGYIDPVIVRPFNGKFQILAGEGRYMACQLNGIDTIPVICVELSDEQALAYMIASNEIPRSSEINPNKFEEVIKTLNSMDPNFQWNSIGLSDQEAGALLNFNADIVNDGAPTTDIHEGIKEKVKPLRLNLEQRAFVEYAISVYNEIAEEPAPHETEAVMHIIGDWLAGMTSPVEDSDVITDLNTENN